MLLDRPGVLVKNKPLRLADELLLPVYDEVRWQVGIARTTISPGAPWRFDDLAIGAGSGVPLIQGTLAEAAPGRLLMLMRTKEGRIWQAESADGGRTWRAIHTLEAGPGEYSYPAIVTDPAGRVHIAYTALRREIRHVVIEP